MNSWWLIWPLLVWLGPYLDQFYGNHPRIFENRGVNWLTVGVLGLVLLGMQWPEYGLGSVLLVGVFVGMSWVLIRRREP